LLSIKVFDIPFFEIVSNEYEGQDRAGEEGEMGCSVTGQGRKDKCAHHRSSIQVFIVPGAVILFTFQSKALHQYCE